VEVEHDQTIIAIVGNEIVSQKAILKNMFSALEPIPLRMISYGGSRHNVSLLIHSSYKEQALRALNKGLFGLD